MRVERDDTGTVVLRLCDAEAELLCAFALRGARWSENSAVGLVAWGIARGLAAMGVQPANWAPRGWLSGAESTVEWVDATPGGGPVTP